MLMATCRPAAAVLGILLCGCAIRSGAQSPDSVAKPASGSPAWVFHNGVYLWGDDYSYVAKAVYTDREGASVSGRKDIKITLLGKWGGFQPVARNWDFDVAPYKYLTFALKPTVPDQALQLYFQKVHDAPVGVSVDPLRYGPKAVPGTWTTYKIPLADLGIAGIHVYKFAIQDKTGLAQNTFYLDEIGFLP